MYDWAGDFVVVQEQSPAAVVFLSDQIDLSSERVAIFGPIKTENIGVEKVIANIISNPFIRYLIIFGTEVRGHRPGETLLCLAQNGIDEKHRVIGSKGAVPYIENLDGDALDRFRQQVTLIDMINVTDHTQLKEKLAELATTNPGSFGEPYIALPVKKEREVPVFSASLALYKSLSVSPFGEIQPFETEGDTHD